MTREEELAAIAAHIAAKGVTRPTGPRPSDVVPLGTVEHAMAWAERNGIQHKHCRNGKYSIEGGPAVQGSRFVAHINAIRARSLGMAVRSDASRLPGSAA